MLIGFLRLLFLTGCGVLFGRVLSHAEFGWFFGGMAGFVVGLFRFDGHR